MSKLEQIKLIDILPPSITHDDQVVAAAAAIDEELKQLSQSIQRLSIFNRLDQLTDEEADELAWQFHVDFYDSSLPIEIKRELVKNSITWHQRKGTPAAVEELITTLFGQGEVLEWFEYGGDPYMFQVITNNPEVTNEKALEFTQALKTVKNARSWLEKVVITNSEDVNLYFGCVLHTGDRLTIRQVV